MAYEIKTSARGTMSAGQISKYDDLIGPHGYKCVNTARRFTDASGWIDLPRGKKFRALLEHADKVALVGAVTAMVIYYPDQEAQLNELLKKYNDAVHDAGDRYQGPVSASIFATAVGQFVDDGTGENSKGVVSYLSTMSFLAMQE